MFSQIALLHHYHPSVALHARQLLTHAQVTATADLGLNTLSHFLDRFVYRNPKKSRPKGASAMQPMAADDSSGMVHAVKATGSADLVNEDGFRRKKEGDVPVDQVRRNMEYVRTWQNRGPTCVAFLGVLSQVFLAEA